MTKPASAALILPDHIEGQILEIRGQKVMLDDDLADLYGVTTKRLNEQVKRNIERFPKEFRFQITKHELTGLRSQFATAKWSSVAIPLMCLLSMGRCRQRMLLTHLRLPK